MKPSRVILLTSVVGWILLYVLGFVALGSSVPTIESSGREIVAWFTDNATNARAYAWTSAFVALALATFGGQIAAFAPEATPVHLLRWGARMGYHGNGPGMVLGRLGPPP